MPLLSREFTRLGMTRLCAWVGVAGAAGVGLLATWRAVLLAVAVSLGGCAALPADVARQAAQDTQPRASIGHTASIRPPASPPRTTT